MPFELNTEAIVIESHEHFVQELIEFTLKTISEGFNNKRSLTSMTNYISEQITAKLNGSWMCLFMPDAIKYCFSLPKFRFLKTSFRRNDHKYLILIA